MPVIQLSERGSGPDGVFQVRMVFEGGAEYESLVTDPGGPAVEQELAWYFEEHLLFPFLDQDRRRAAVAALRSYGEELFGQVFAGAAGERYRWYRDRGFGGCRLEVTGSAGFHRLHWEAIRDPQLDMPLAVRIPVTRRVEPPAGFVLPDQHPTLNILLVTARPDGPNDAGYRTISRPLLNALRQGTLPVTVDLVRPGTWDALREHLQVTSERRGFGWYHLVHFDLPGAFRDFDSLCAGQQTGRLLFADDTVTEFGGKQGFVFFETAIDGQSHPVPAAVVADLLAEHRVPMAVLNACQPATRTANEEAALAQQLVEAGVPAVVGMAYPVTVSAAALAMPVLYQRLSRGMEPDLALQAIRRRLYEQRHRRAYFDQQLELEDWALPVVFRQRRVNIELRPMTEPETDQFYRRQEAAGDEPATEYGFVGRDLDIQAIERRLLMPGSPNQLLVHGMAGAGKSTLIAHLGWWWQRTGLVEQVLAFSYADRAWTADEIIREIAARLLDRVDQARLDNLSEPARRERIAHLLRSTRHLLVLDNAESITAGRAAIPHTLDKPQRDLLRQFLFRLRGGATLVLLGSREPETWLADDSFADNVYPLPGLDPQAGSILAERILTRHNATNHRNDPTQRKALEELLDLLGGYPLPLEVVLPVLAHATAQTVINELNTGDTTDPAGLILRAVGYSHGKLDPALQAALLLFAPFTDTIPAGPILDRYHHLLAEQPASHPLDAIDLHQGLQSAIDIGLAAPHPVLAGWVRLVPVLTYFLRNRLRNRPDLYQAAATAHYHLHTESGQQLYGLLHSTEPDDLATGQAATKAVHDNLAAALQFAINNAHPVWNLVAPLEAYLDQTHQQPARQHLLDSTIDAVANRKDPAARVELADLQDLGGIVAQQQRRFAEAEDLYRQALGLKLEFNDQHGVASTYHQLGMVVQEQRRFAEAEELYRQALERFSETDKQKASQTAIALGTVLGAMNRHAEAIRTLLDAAISWRQLTGQFDENALNLLAAERAIVGEEDFDRRLPGHRPDDLVTELVKLVTALNERRSTGSPAE